MKQQNIFFGDIIILGVFFGDHEGDNVYLEEDLIKANFKAFKAYLMRADPSVISFAEFAKPYYLETRK